ncbi:hypothetical protein BSP10_025 [Bacillus phage BSP10]|nr:hypothetical protein BSP10_025 [Bacillus phage BSP10]
MFKLFFLVMLIRPIYVFFRIICIFLYPYYNIERKKGREQKPLYLVDKIINVFTMKKLVVSSLDLVCECSHLWNCCYCVYKAYDFPSLDVYCGTKYTVYGTNGELSSVNGHLCLQSRSSFLIRVNININRLLVGPVCCSIVSSKSSVQYNLNFTYYFIREAVPSLLVPCIL